MHRLVFFLLASLALSARAQPLDAGTFARASASMISSTSARVRLGETGTVDVGFARGLWCDDLTIADVSLQSGDARSNLMVIHPLRGGTMQCRAGTTQGGNQMLVQITVIP